MILKSLRGVLLSFGITNRSQSMTPTLLSETTTATCIVEDCEPVLDASDQLIAWEQDRAVTLREATTSEQHGLKLLTRAALLRLVVQFEDEGLFVVANELRQQADRLDNKPSQEPELVPSF